MASAPRKSYSTPRTRLLRKARDRALARLRAEYDARYQQLMEEEIAILGGEPRGGTIAYRPRSEEFLRRQEAEGVTQQKGASGDDSRGG